jgi:DNA recombination protein RmuC
MLTILLSVALLFCLALLFFKKNDGGLQAFVLQIHDKINNESKSQIDYIQKALSEHSTQFDARQLASYKMLQESLQQTMHDMRQQISQFLETNTKSINERIEGLNKTTNERLKDISGQVEKRLAEGFEKTTQTFTDIVKRLALIDEAQKKITELSSNVVSLQSILSDKRSRGAFGEVQLNSLIRNVMPENSFSLQHTLSNDKRADCVLFLPEPSGHIVIDAKFPLETYRRLNDQPLSDIEKRPLESQFRQDLKAHINAIADKYIIAHETADGAMMFIPAEAIFAEIHAHYPDIVELANKKRVWLVSPTTMMAVLTTARAVLKDADTRQQVHIIQEHLGHLGKDFGRFQTRMDNLAKHIDLAQQDVSLVHKSAKKITSRFDKIERLDLSGDEIKQLTDTE